MAEQKTREIPTDDKVREYVKKAAADLALAETSNGVCILATIRVLRDFFGFPAEEFNRALTWLSSSGHGLASNASQLGAWTKGKKAEATNKFANIKS